MRPICVTVLLCWVALLPFSQASFQIILPLGEVFPYAKLHGSIDVSLTDYTLCHWTRLINEKDGWATVFSYAVGKLDNHVGTYINQRQYALEMWRQTSSKSLKTDLLDIGGERYKWVHACVTWSIVEGAWQIFYNGVLKGTGKGLAPNEPTLPDGVVILGQDQDILGGKFEEKDALRGHISEVNMWDYVLTNQDVYKVYNCSFGEDGNVVGWNRNSWILYNGARVANVRLPCAHRL